MGSRYPYKIMGEDNQVPFRSEGEPAFPELDTENDNSADSPSEKTDTDSTQSSEGDQNSDANKEGGDEKKSDGEKKGKDKGLADHPRWIKRENNWKKRYNDQEERHTNEIAKLRTDLEGQISKAGTSNQQGDQTPDKPAWFGGTDEEWSSFVGWHREEIGKAHKGAVDEITSKQEGDQAKLDEATKYLTDTIDDIESDPKLNPSGEKINRNKLLKFVIDNDLVDSQARWNYKAGFLLMQGGVKSTKASKTTERKRIAGATTSEKSTETKPSTIKTSEDFAKPGSRPW